jgi:hypothetical protein
LYFFDWDWQAADAEMKHSLLLDPNVGESYRWAAMTAATLGRFDEAQDLLRQALARDPLEAFSYATISGYLMQKGQWSDALQAGARAHDLMPLIETGMPMQRSPSCRQSRRRTLRVRLPGFMRCVAKTIRHSNGWIAHTRFAITESRK